MAKCKALTASALKGLTDNKIQFDTVKCEKASFDSLKTKRFVAVGAP